MKPMLNFLAICLLSCLLWAQPAPDISITQAPVAMGFSYYDYMVGGRYSLPLRNIQNIAGGGYFATFHARTSGSVPRRVYYSYLWENSSTAITEPLNPISTYEGYPSLSVDPVSGKPIYTWHAETVGQELDVLYTMDSFVAGITGLLSPVRTVIDNPVSITHPDGTITTDNVFLWPTSVIGPSPIVGKRRIYIAARNNVRRQCTTMLLAYADFNTSDIEAGTELSWSYTSIPTLDTWALDSSTMRSPYLALACDDAGNIYLCGYHTAYNPQTYEQVIEPPMDVFKCSDFGQGTWSYHSSMDRLPSWNPPASPQTGDGYFTNEDGIPYADAQLYWELVNSSHLNATVDNFGRIHVPALWCLMNADGAYYPELHVVKEFVFDPAYNSFEIIEIYPQKNPDDAVNNWFQPWDRQAPYGIADGWTEDGGIWTPNMHRDWPFCLYDHFAEYDPMFGTYNNIKITEANPMGWMAVLWQSSWRARLRRVYNNHDYDAWYDTPEIMISFSMDNGNTWMEPVSINNVDYPEFSGRIPMWSYPADQIIYQGHSGGNRLGKLGIMFFDDYFWFANCISAALLANPGGEVMFTEVQLSVNVENDDPTAIPSPVLLTGNHPNPFSYNTAVTYEVTKSSMVELAVYNVKGQKIRTLFSGTALSGQNSITWDGCDGNGKRMPSGMYFCRITSGEHSQTRKLMLIH